MERLEEICERRIQLAARDVARFEEGLRQGSRKHVEIVLGRFLRATAQLESSLTEHGADQESRFRQRKTQLAERTRRIAEQKQSELNHAAQLLLRDTADRAQAASEYLARSVQGLVEGSRKQQDLYDERQRRRLGQLTSRILQQVRDRFVRLVNTGTRLRERTETRLTRNETGVAQVARQIQLSTEVHLRAKANELSLLPRRALSAARIVEERERNLAEKGKRLEALDPVRLLERGYTVTRTSDGRVIKTRSDVQVGEHIFTQLRDGLLVSRILEATEEPL